MRFCRQQLVLFGVMIAVLAACSAPVPVMAPTLTPMSSIRIPLSDITGIDRSRIKSIGLALEGQPTGSILFADLEFLSVTPVALRSTSFVSGVINAATPFMLTRNLVVNVQLQDTSQADAPATTIGQQLINANGRQVPLAFEIEYPIDQIDPTHVYTLQARITLGNQPLFETPQPIPVLTAGNPSTGVEIIVQPVP